jgi:hypothetical protein
LLRALRTARIALARCVFGLPCAILISLSRLNVIRLLAFSTLCYYKTDWLSFL